MYTKTITLFDPHQTFYVIRNIKTILIINNIFEKTFLITNTNFKTTIYLQVYYFT